MTQPGLEPDPFPLWTCPLLGRQNGPRNSLSPLAPAQPAPRPRGAPLGQLSGQGAREGGQLTPTPTPAGLSSGRAQRRLQGEPRTRPVDGCSLRAPCPWTWLQEVPMPEPHWPLSRVASVLRTCHSFWQKSRSAPQKTPEPRPPSLLPLVPAHPALCPEAPSQAPLGSGVPPRAPRGQKHGVHPIVTVIRGSHTPSPFTAPAGLMPRAAQRSPAGPGCQSGLGGSDLWVGHSMLTGCWVHPELGWLGPSS